jgi:Ni/Fe-hydrogenase subunit HybB-like protein
VSVESDDEKSILRWKIGKELNLYKFYLEVSVKTAVFLMTVTGAIASYVLNKVEKQTISMALVFPALVDAGFAVLFLYSMAEAKRIARVHADECKSLGVQGFNLNPLRAVCQLFFVMCTLATVGLLWLLVFQLRQNG